MWGLYTFWRSDKGPRYHWKIYIFHTVGSLFILMLFSLAAKKLFILMRSHLFILSFMFLALEDMSVRMLLCGMSQIFLTMFSSRTFMVLRLIFKSFIHLEFIFVYGVSWWSSFMLCMLLSRSPNTICWRGYFYSMLCICPLCQILIDHRNLGLFLGCLFCFIGVCVHFP